MIIVKEIQIFRRCLLKFFGVFSSVVLVLLVISIDRCTRWNMVPECFSFDAPSIATQLFFEAQRWLVPEGVSVIALDPLTLFWAPLSFAVLLGIFITFPYFLWLLAGFIWPALHQVERQLVARFLVPAGILFYTGGAFTLFLLLPQTFALLYSFAPSLGVTPFFSLDKFLATTVTMTIVVGIIFLLPIVMVLLSRLRFVSGVFWQHHWRGALLGVLLFSAIITPDGSGLTMIFLSLPLWMLYGLGIMLIQMKRLV